MSAYRLKATGYNIALNRVTFEPVDSIPHSICVPGATGCFIDQATIDRTLAFDAELVKVDPVAATFTFKALGQRAGGRGVDVHAGDIVRLLVRHKADPGTGIQSTIPGQTSIGESMADEPTIEGVAYGTGMEGQSTVVRSLDARLADKGLEPADYANLAAYSATDMLTRLVGALGMVALPAPAYPFWETAKLWVGRFGESGEPSPFEREPERVVVTAPGLPGHHGRRVMLSTVAVQGLVKEALHGFIRDNAAEGGDHMTRIAGEALAWRIFGKLAALDPAPADA